MAKGDDAVRKKKNKQNRKHVRSSESAVSARVAAIIATKRRRKAGKRRICEGMCYSLPTPDDPFNDRQGKKKEVPKKKQKQKQQQQLHVKRMKEADHSAKRGDDSYGCPSKFLIVCLNAIKDAGREEGQMDENTDGPLAISSWGLDLWRCCSIGSNVLDASGACATREQIAWLLSIASDIVVRKEKQGVVLCCPFLLYLVPTQEKAIQVRSVCKPLKSLGIHSVSLHPGAPIDHQVQGLKSCEPEFLISTPERLVELVSLRAIDISAVSLLVVDGLRGFEDCNLGDKVSPVREMIRGNPHVVVFGNYCTQAVITLVTNVVAGTITRLSLHDSLVSHTAFISQYVHFYASDEQKFSKVLEILMQASSSAKILLITSTASKDQLLASFPKQQQQSYAISSLDDDSVTFLNSEKERKKQVQVMIKKREDLQMVDVEQFEVVAFVDFPSSIEEYLDVARRTARHSVVGALHSFFCKEDAPFAKALIDVLRECGQVVPQFLLDMDSS